MSSKEAFGRYFYLHFEWIVLAIGLISMMMMEPNSSGASLCLIEWLGFQWCPGDGLGNAIALAARGEWMESFHSHPAGIPAIAVLSTRIGSIFYRNYQLMKGNEL